MEDYSCSCNSGFEERVDEQNGEKICGNIDDCPEGACGEHGTCIDLVQGYTCECSLGYEIIEEGPDKTCKGVKCGAVEKIANSKMTTDASLSFPEKVLVECE